MIGDMIKRNGGNVLKAGVFLLLSNLANEALRTVARETMDVMARDIRRARTEWRERTERRSQAAD